MDLSKELEKQKRNRFRINSIITAVEKKIVDHVETTIQKNYSGKVHKSKKYNTDYEFFCVEGYVDSGNDDLSAVHIDLCFTEIRPTTKQRREQLQTFKDDKMKPRTGRNYLWTDIYRIKPLYIVLNFKVLVSDVESGLFADLEINPGRSSLPAGNLADRFRNVTCGDETAFNDKFFPASIKPINNEL